MNGFDVSKKTKDHYLIAHQRKLQNRFCVVCGTKLGIFDRSKNLCKKPSCKRERQKYREDLKKRYIIEKVIDSG